MVCYKTYYTIKQCTKNARSHSSKLQSTGTNSYLPFTPRHFWVLFHLFLSGIPICMLCLSACLLIVCPNGHWNEWLLVSWSLTTRNPKSVAFVDAYVVSTDLRGCISWAKIVLSLFVTNIIHDKICCLCFLAFSPPHHRHYNLPINKTKTVQRLGVFEAHEDNVKDQR